MKCDVAERGEIEKWFKLAALTDAIPMRGVLRQEACIFNGFMYA